MVGSSGIAASAAAATSALQHANFHTNFFAKFPVLTCRFSSCKNIYNCNTIIIFLENLAVLFAKSLESLTENCWFPMQNKILNYLVLLLFRDTFWTLYNHLWGFWPIPPKNCWYLGAPTAATAKEVGETAEKSLGGGRYNRQSRQQQQTYRK